MSNDGRNVRIYVSALEYGKKLITQLSRPTGWVGKAMCASGQVVCEVQQCGFHVLPRSEEEVSSTHHLNRAGGTLR